MFMSKASIQLLSSRSLYPQLTLGLEKLTSKVRTARLRNLCLTDLYFLLRYAFNRPDADNDWVFDRCREIQAAPDGYLDLWAREHYKSTIITSALTIQNILNDPEVTVGIFSHTRGIAKGWLRQIKRELASNDRLKAWFPDVLWDNPEREAPKWSEDDGIIVKRKSNPPESTVEAWGLVDGQPTSRHFEIVIYDDVVVKESTGTPEQIAKTTEAWELSLSLGKQGGRTRYCGTRYHFNDTYAEIMRRNAAVPRIKPATADGDMDGEAVFMSRELLDNKRRKMGPYTFACQMLLDPKGDETQGFKEEWLRYYEGYNDGAGMNIYILADPASEKKKSSDYTAMWVIGLGRDENYYGLEFYRDRLNLTQRADLLFRLHKRWKPRGVGYERYGFKSDIEHMQDRMRREHYNFEITELGGQMPKRDRIRRLIPVFEQGRLWLPETNPQVQYDGERRELVRDFINDEYKAFPVCPHDDMLDALSRILDEDMEAAWPGPRPRKEPTDPYDRPRHKASGGVWAG